jgi:hypothetical protein
MTYQIFKPLFLAVLNLSVVQARVSNRRGIMEEESTIRHDTLSSPIELNVDAKSTYNDKFMALMKSPCRPEYDGFFGATYGVPVQMQYGFRLETMPLSSIMDMLDVIEDKLVDDILQSSFPEMCGYRRRQLSHAIGFRFLKFQEVGKSAQTNPVVCC